MNITATLIGQMIVFTVLVWFIKGVMWEPILTAMQARQKRIADGLAAAEQGLQNEELAKQAAIDELKKAKTESAEIIAQAQKRASEIVEEAKGTATEEAGRVTTAAQAEIEQEVTRAREGLRSQVASLAVTGAEKILGKEIDAKAHAKALDDLASQI